MRMTSEVIVVGAGAAGVSCACELKRRGVDFAVIEARSRIGGRVLSSWDSDFQIPLELGAEFIHGAPKSILELMQTLHLPFYDVKDDHLFLQKKKLTKANDFWSRLQNVMTRVSLAKGQDESVADFLKKQKKIDGKTKDFFKSFVEGFHAADLNHIGRRGLASTEEVDDDELNGSKMFRHCGRYDLLLSRLVELNVNPSCLHFHTVLQKIEWAPGYVRLTCEKGPFKTPVVYECKKLILTVPLGVLKSRGIQWDPQPKNLESILSCLHMGHVQRIVFRFRRRFWEKSTDEPVSFLHHSADQFFPTWWSFLPLRTPHLVAWQGGPKAIEMAEWPEGQRIECALQTLSELVHCSVKNLNSEVESWATHNWTADPFAFGAYSYMGVHGSRASKQLSQGFGRTIFFAGEALDVGPGRGTVHGAFESGVRSVQNI